MSTWDGTERRKKKRFGVRGCTLRYKKGGLLSFLSSYSDKLLTLNLSETGCHFIARRAVPAGMPIAVLLEAPQAGDRISASGRVVWCAKSKEHEAFHVGVEFLSVPKAGRIQLKVLIDNSVLEKIDLSTKVYLKEIERL
ncbi:MAG: PilZ domain-containing protein [Candidatus Brocadiae bacterium]|nr:PilZ domain-containing protein [Candidatus Brocadiia bacterium]